MSGCGDTVDPICPCDRFVHPRVITNPPGLSTIAYRAGDYTSFRHALLLARPGETQLTQTDGTDIKPIWRPAAQGDLAVQMMEWWAYLCDILTFYDERVANQTYLGTAGLPESVKRLVAVLGYRPRPGIGATGVLAALASGPNPFTLPAGLPIQSKPGPGQQPHVFELMTAATITPPIGPPGSSIAQGILPVVPTPVPIPALAGAAPTAVIAGTISALKPGDRVLILPIGSSGSGQGSAVATATSITSGKDALGSPITSFALGAVASNLSGDTTQFHLLRSSSSVQVWQYPADPAFIVTAGQPVIRSGQPSPTLQIDLLTIVRGLTAGDPIVFEFLDGSKPPQFGRLVSSTEVIWYANPLGYDPAQPSHLTGINPAIPPSFLGSPVSAPPSLAIPLPHTRITIEWSNGPSPTTLNNPPNYLIRYGWKDVGNLTVPPPPQVGPTDGDSGAGNGTAAAPHSPLTLQPSGGDSFPVPAGTSVLVRDVHGNGASGVVDGPTSMHLIDPVPALVQPLQALFNLLTVTCGKTVANEVLGSGNALVAGQDFVLQKSPVTYLQDPKSISGDDYSSTVRVRVNQLEWSEARSFYDKPPDAKIFVTYEDEQGNTHVVFGDGQNGSRLPTGVNNVVASYRYGSGAAVPSPGSLTVVLQPQPGLRSILNPVPVGGGADPDPRTRICLRAPRSVRTLGRAISIDDFEAVALDAPGVTRAMAALQFDPRAQRPAVTVWVGDDAAAVTAARAAFAATADPNRQPQVVLAQRVRVTLSLTIVYDRSHVTQIVHDAVHAALVDPDNGLFGRNVVLIGQVFYDSQIYAACLKVPGVQAVHSLHFNGLEPQSPTSVSPGNGSQPGNGSGSTQDPALSDQRHDPGPGAYFLLSDTDGQPDLSMGAGAMINDQDHYEAYYADKLWNLLPAVYRAQDSDPTHTNGPLREIVNRIGAQAAILRRGIDRLWEDQSIETCDDWVIPYIGDLLATNLVSNLDASTLRRDVAKTIYYRRRKGTPNILEEVASDITGWHPKVVEFSRRLGRTRHGLDPAIGMATLGDCSIAGLQQAEALVGPLTRTGIGGLADLRKVQGASKVNTAFDEFFHTADVRQGRGRSGWYGIPRLGVFLWRLQSFGVDQTTPVESSQCPGQFTFDPTGRDIPLFAAAVPRQGNTWVSAAEWQLPTPITPSLLQSALGQTTAHAGVRQMVSGQPPDCQNALIEEDAWQKAILYATKTNDVLALNALGVFQAGPASGVYDLIPASALTADRSNPGPAAFSGPAASVPPPSFLIDPSRGRLIALTHGPIRDLRVTYHYGFSSTIGAGPYDRQIGGPQPSTPDPKLSYTGGGHALLASSAIPTAGTVTLGDSLTYTAINDVTVKGCLIINAANEERPVVRLAPTKNVTFNGVPGAPGNVLVLDGLFFNGADLVLTGTFDRVTVNCCTLDPGTAAPPATSPAASLPSLFFAVAVDGRPLAPSHIWIEGQVGTLTIDRSITGPIRDRNGGQVETLTITDSIIQAIPTEIASAASMAFSASIPQEPADAALALIEGDVNLSRSTVLGRVVVHRLQASECILRDEVQVDDTQHGCIRFTAWADGSSLPRQYESARISSGAQIFTSIDFGQPGYCQLLPTADAAILTPPGPAPPTPPTIVGGAENGTEMGAFARELNPIKAGALSLKYQEYMPVGLVPVLIDVT